MPLRPDGKYVPYVKKPKAVPAVAQITIIHQAVADVSTVEGPRGRPGPAGRSGNFSGSGSPEGVQAGIPGDTYWDTANQIFYVKDSGSGSTGWQELVA